MRSSLLVLIAVLLVALYQWFHFYALLPPVLASHFGADGQPNGWSSKSSFFVMEWAIIGALAFVFIVLPRFLQRLPNEWINLPSKDYWLAEERRNETVAFIQHMVEWMGVVALAFVTTLIQWTIQINLHPGGTFSQRSMILFPGIYLLFIVGWSIRFFLRFRLPQKSG
ncbi:MAG: DUF1648 domain-containing protein [Acidobacteriia bacterium]|nr:DUF1648 domain-containing protein [Terriglobia bacterium]